jgi:hypothetical protein
MVLEVNISRIVRILEGLWWTLGLMTRHIFKVMKVFLIQKALKNRGRTWQDGNRGMAVFNSFIHGKSSFFFLEKIPTIPSGLNDHANSHNTQKACETALLLKASMLLQRWILLTHKKLQYAFYWNPHKVHLLELTTRLEDWMSSCSPI